jgi:hypothetical protein
VSIEIFETALDNAPIDGRKVERELRRVLHVGISERAGNAPALGYSVRLSANTFVAFRPWVPAHPAFKDAPPPKGFLTATVYLHGNPIAYVAHGGRVRVDIGTYKNWRTVTTRSRLRALGVDLDALDEALGLKGTKIDRIERA